MPHPVTNFEIRGYYQNEARSDGVYSKNDIQSKKDGSYTIKLNECAGVGKHWIALFCTEIEIIYFGSFGVEHVPKEIEKLVGHKNMKTNIFRIQSNNSLVCGYFCIGFIDFMFADKTLIDHTSLFSSYDCEKNDSIILIHFKDEWK